MAGNDGIGDSGQPSFPKVHIGAADFGREGFQHDLPRFRIGDGELAQLRGAAGRGKHRRPHHPFQAVVPPQLEPAPAVHP